MNGAKAKALRRRVYGDESMRDRKYGVTNVRNYKQIAESADCK